jgi:hypothetical protein
MQAVLDVHRAQAVRRQRGPLAGQPVQQNVGIAPAAVGDAQRDRWAVCRQRGLDPIEARIKGRIETRVGAHPSL